MVVEIMTSAVTLPQSSAYCPRHFCDAGKAAVPHIHGFMNGFMNDSWMAGFMNIHFRESSADLPQVFRGSSAVLVKRQNHDSLRWTHNFFTVNIHGCSHSYLPWWLFRSLPPIVRATSAVPVKRRVSKRVGIVFRDSPAFALSGFNFVPHIQSTSFMLLNNCSPTL